MTKKSNKDALIETIMKTRYGNDDPKYDRTNLAFLESLSIAELTAMVETDIFLDKFGCFPDDDEIVDIVFDDDL
jgi:hypothetical protein